ncbi:TIGR03943 family putative permease subunit [Nonomuraea basaltis]|uniref:TIGR03943 family putative permease subunit n=1 Tax=Nonomuraea basaltis TaxID=2495887 RepID=UPI00110C52EC|nr:TIGR03943 family protein [Nonomuraea basaltis]TMR88426.1 TIGR03943 family protein [Nonomuraea basaltis]
MTRSSQGLLLILLGGALLQISAFSADFANYVKPGFRPLLIAAGAVLIVLGVAVLAAERRRRRDAASRAALARAGLEEELHLARLLGREPAVSGPGARDEHDEHHDGIRVAWLLAVPVAAIFLIAPPALGSYAVQQAEHAPAPPPPSVVDADLPPLKSGRVNDLSMSEFAGRTWSDPGSLKGRTVRLTGFVVPSASGREWYVARLRIGCCAADALTMKAAVRGAPAPGTDTWVRVTGTWVPADGTAPPALDATRVEAVAAPGEPYE